MQDKRGPSRVSFAIETAAVDRLPISLVRNPPENVALARCIIRRENIRAKIHRQSRLQSRVDTRARLDEQIVFSFF